MYQNKISKKSRSSTRLLKESELSKGFNGAAGTYIENIFCAEAKIKNKRRHFRYILYYFCFNTSEVKTALWTNFRIKTQFSGSLEIIQMSYSKIYIT